MDASTPGFDLSSIRLIGAAVTPAVMVSGCGILATGLDNQVSRITARVRDMVREWRTLPEGHLRRALLREEVAILDRRHALLARALMLDYAALLSFVATSLLYLVQRRFNVPEVAPVVAFVDSMRGLSEDELPAGVTWESFIDRVREQVSDAIRREGAWRMHNRVGLFTCR